MGLLAPETTTDACLPNRRTAIEAGAATLAVIATSCCLAGRDSRASLRSRTVIWSPLDVPSSRWASSTTTARTAHSSSGLRHRHFKLPTKMARGCPKSRSSPEEEVRGSEEAARGVEIWSDLPEIARERCRVVLRTGKHGLKAPVETFGKGTPTANLFNGTVREMVTANPM